MFWPKSPHVFFSTSVFRHCVVLLLTHVCTGELIVATLGNDAILPCHLEPPMNEKTLKWLRPDLDPNYVHVWHNGEELEANHHPSYKGRTSLFNDKLKNGDLSLKLSAVKLSDSGTYKCSIPGRNMESTIELIVGAASSPIISLSGNERDKGRVVLQCESKGWYPEPELLWLDAEGKLLSAGPTETVRGPDVLYTVSSRVTVEKRHGNSFTCRVQQKTINQTTVTHVNVADDFFMVTSNCTASIALSLVFCLMLIIAVALSVWKWRQNKPNQEEKPTEDQALLESKKREDLYKEKIKLDEKLKVKEEEQRDVAQMENILMEVNEKVKKLKEQLKEHMKKTESEAEETEKKLKLVEEEVEESGDKVKGYLKLRELMVQNDLDDRKNEYQDLHMNTEKLMERACHAVKQITDKEDKVKDQIEEIKQQLQDTEKQMN